MVYQEDSIGFDVRLGRKLELTTVNPSMQLPNNVTANGISIHPCQSLNKVLKREGKVKIKSEERAKLWKEGKEALDACAS